MLGIAPSSFSLLLASRLLLPLLLRAKLPPLAFCIAIACQLSTDRAGWSSPRSGHLCWCVPFRLQRLNLVSFPISYLLRCHLSSPNVVVHRDAASLQLALLSPSFGWIIQISEHTELWLCCAQAFAFMMWIYEVLNCNCIIYIPTNSLFFSGMPNKTEETRIYNKQSITKCQTHLKK